MEPSHCICVLVAWPLLHRFGAARAKLTRSRCKSDLTRELRSKKKHAFFFVVPFVCIIFVPLKNKDMDFEQLVQQRRSHRKFDGRKVTDEEMHLILRAALMSPTAMNRQSWHFYLTRDRELLRRLSTAKKTGALMVAEADVAVAITCNPDEDGCWIEDCSVAAVVMQYQAEELGLGSCWVEMRDHQRSDGTPAEEAVREILGIDGSERVLCLVAFGHAADKKEPADERKLKWTAVKTIG